MSAESGEGSMTKAERLMVRISFVQTILAVAAMFTGAIALWAALNEADAVRKQQQAAAWPFVDASTVNYNLPGQESFTLDISNKGLGPARIVSAYASIDGEPAETWWTLIAIAAGVDLEAGEQIGINNAPIVGRVISPGERISIVGLDQYSTVTNAEGEQILDYQALLAKFRQGANDRSFGFTICYCSVFDDCWQLDRGEGPNPKEVDVCPAQPEGVIY